MKKFKPLTPVFIFLLLILSCSPKSLEKAAIKDADEFLKNLYNTEKLLNHQYAVSTDIPPGMSKKLKEKNIELMQNSVAEICENTKDFKLLETYRKIGDNDQKLLFLEYELCPSALVIMSYEVNKDKVLLINPWVMRNEQRPENMLTQEKMW